MPLSERLNTPISNAELERRWRAVRAAMEKEKIDVLLMQNNNDHMGGYVRYFTDVPAVNGYPNTVVFPRDADMTVVTQGPFGGALHQGLRPRARRACARAVCQGDDRPRRHLPDVVRRGRLHQAAVSGR